MKHQQRWRGSQNKDDNRQFMIAQSHFDFHSVSQKALCDTSGRLNSNKAEDFVPARAEDSMPND